MGWAPDYVTLAEVRSFLRIGDTDDDAELGLAIAAASRAVDTDTNRQFGVVAAAEARLYTPRWDRRRCRWLVDIDDLMTTSGLLVAIEDVPGVVSYTLEPRNAAAKGRPWELMVIDVDSAVRPTGAEHEASLTGVWGWTAVPSTVKEASLLQGSRFFARRTSPYGVAGSPDLGSELRLLARVDADVSVMLRPYRRWWAAA